MLGIYSKKNAKKRLVFIERILGNEIPMHKKQ